MFTCVKILNSYINTALIQLARRIYKCYIIISFLSKLDQHMFDIRHTTYRLFTSWSFGIFNNVIASSKMKFGGLTFVIKSFISGQNGTT